MALYRKTTLTEARRANESGKVYDKLHDCWIPYDAGDMILTGPKGEEYPVRKDVFEATYELAHTMGQVDLQPRVKRLEAVVEAMLAYRKWSKETDRSDVITKLQLQQAINKALAAVEPGAS